MCSPHTPTAHLVELVDAADAQIGEHEGTRLEHEVLGLRITDHGRGQTDGRGALARGVDAARGDLVDVAEELRLGRTGVAAHEHVDLAARFARLLLNVALPVVDPVPLLAVLLVPVLVALAARAVGRPRPLVLPP